MDAGDIPAGDELDRLVARLVFGSPAYPPYSSSDPDALNLLLHTRSEGWWWKVESKGGSQGEWEAWTDHESDPDATRGICWEAPTFALAVCRATVMGHRLKLALEEE